MSREPRRGLRPTIAARSLWARIEAIQRKRAFVAAYRAARAALIAGNPVPFPTERIVLGKTHRFLEKFGSGLRT